MPDDQHSDCNCWRCWLQMNFTALVLIALMLVVLGATVALMHEEKIPDEYVKWLQTLCLTILGALTLALKGSGGKP